MFLEKTLEKNLGFVLNVAQLHKEGKIAPDSYVIDVNTFESNAKKMIEAAKKKEIRLFFMLKQVGRNPYLAKKLIDLGYSGAVVVDFREAEVMMKNNIPIGNVGHLVQPPKQYLEKLIQYNCEVFTVFSFEKCQEINEICTKLNRKQKVIIKVYDNQDILYSMQEGGVHLSNLVEFLNQLKELEFIEVVGVTAFPCFLYDNQENDILPTNNYGTVLKARDILVENGFKIEVLNLPSSTCTHLIDKIDDNLNNVVLEPGHGLSGTTPYHSHYDSVEIPCVVYLSEISHHYQNQSYCYGGGHYRRSHVQNAIVFKDYYYDEDKVTPASDEAIDYYFKLNEMHPISSTVIMAFRFQMFVSRSNVVLIENSNVVGVYNGLGDCYE